MQQDIIQESRDVDAGFEDEVLQEETAESQQTEGENENIVIERGRIPSPLEEALLDFGKNLVKDSVAQSVEFHKTMLGLTATFATLMASAFGILAFGSKDKPLDAFQRVFLVIPVLLMLLSSICFALGYYPRHMKIKLRVLNTIEKARDELLQARGIWAFCGILLFTLAILSLLIDIIFFNVG